MDLGVIRNLGEPSSYIPLLIGSASPLCGVWLAQHFETKRRQLDIESKAANRDHEHLERLYHDRLDTYKEFNAKYLDFRRAYTELARWWGQRQSLSGMPRATLADADFVPRFESVEARFTGALQAVTNAMEALEESIAHLELVASDDVLTAANDLTTLVLKEWEVSREFQTVVAPLLARGEVPADFEDKWTAWHQASLGIQSGRLTLRNAIRDELRLEAQLGRG